MNYVRPDTSKGLAREGMVLIENSGEGDIGNSSKKNGSPMPNSSF